MKRGRSVRRATTRAVYTALIGRYEPLAEQPLAASSDTDFICLTDVPDLVSATWQIHQVEPVLPEDPIRSARYLKICGHPRLAGYRESLWVDARVILDVDPSDLLGAWLDGADVAVPMHSFRDSVGSEFAEISRLGIDDPGRVDEQRSHYADGGEARLGAAVPWTGMIARRSSAPVQEAMDEWMRHVWRYSRRDQLSFVEAMARRDMPYRLIEIDNLESTFHRWPRRPASHATVPAARPASDGAAWTSTALADSGRSELA